MRLSLGFENRNPLQVLARWGSELRSKFFLGDEDFVPSTWSFEASQISTDSPGVTFSNLQIYESDYLHVGNLCLWKLFFSVQGSADFINLRFPKPPPTPKRNGTAPKAIGASGTVYPGRSVATGASNLILSPCLNFQGANSLDFLLWFSLSPYVYLYTNAGAQIAAIDLSGFYFTKNKPGR